MEALSSGVPLIAYKLPGIPNEYDNYINYSKGNNIRDLTVALTDILNDLSGLYKNKAFDAKMWVNETKNQTVQCKRILELVYG